MCMSLRFGNSINAGVMLSNLTDNTCTKETVWSKQLATTLGKSHLLVPVLKLVEFLLSAKKHSCAY